MKILNKKTLISSILAICLLVVTSPATTAQAAHWHHGSYPKTVRGYWHTPINRYSTASQYQYTRKYQTAWLYGKVIGKWKHAYLNNVNLYHGSLRYKVIGHHKYYFKATRQELNDKWFVGPDRMILTRKNPHKLTIKLHNKDSHKWYKAQSYTRGKIH